MQSKELPPIEEIEALIGQHNKQLRALAQARPQSTDAQGNTHGRTDLPQTTFPGFFNHFILGSIVALARVDVEEATFKGVQPDVEQVNGFRDKAIGLVAGWIDAGRTTSSLERETCEAFLEASSSFDWSTNPDLLHQLSSVGSELGNDYSMLINGQRLIGH